MNSISSKTGKLILSGLFAALTAVCAWIAIPLPFTPVPVVLATMVTMLAGGLLDWKWATASMTVYILLGAVGVPVFHNFTGGLGIIAGPTGGYLVGYITSALICGLMIKGLCKEKLSWWKIALSCTVGIVTCYILGTIWFMAISGTKLVAALVACVIPFIPGEILKIIAATLLIKKIRPIVYKNR